MDNDDGRTADREYFGLLRTGGKLLITVSNQDRHTPQLSPRSHNENTPINLCEIAFEARHGSTCNRNSRRSIVRGKTIVALLRNHGSRGSRRYLSATDLKFRLRPIKLIAPAIGGDEEQQTRKYATGGEGNPSTDVEFAKRRYTVAHSGKTKRPSDIRRRLLHANTPRGSSDDTHCADPTFRDPHLYANHTFYHSHAIPGTIRASTG